MRGFSADCRSSSSVIITGVGDSNSESRSVVVEEFGVGVVVGGITGQGGGTLRLALGTMDQNWTVAISLTGE